MNLDVFDVTDMQDDQQIELSNSGQASHPRGETSEHAEVTVSRQHREGGGQVDIRQPRH